MLEGALLHPKHVWNLGEQLPGQVRACFMGFSEVDPTAKLNEIRRYGGGPQDWMKRFDDPSAIKQIEYLKAVSQHLRLECDKYNLHYIEVSADHQETMRVVVDYLKGQADP